ncbi:DapH/DapD/GlmU-related protein [Collinsella vaginalis]|uniref:DapH/DapD/GlmU-related protein n=1 Tax=Collinsella vaginalis TaxID=1870987 RepID=UPI000A26E01D|nr:DapH/DapD/GlmU-related protein [Collinsella vaginalis]
MYLIDNFYSPAEVLEMIVSTIRTRLFFPGARLIRFPFYLRGKPRLRFGAGFTTGYRCRIEIIGDGRDDRAVKLTLGENARLGDQVHIVSAERVRIGDNFLAASKVFISDCAHGCYTGGGSSAPDTDPAARPLTSAPVTIGDNVWLGENVCVLPGVSIGDGSVIGSNAVVTHDIPAGCIAAGVPAQVIKRYDPATKSWDPVL